MKCNLKVLCAMALAAVMNAVGAYAADTITVAGKYLDRPMKVMVALPTSYAAGDVPTKYPTLYMLNGHGGDYRNWSRIINVDSVANAMNAIIVCPSGRNSWYWDSPVNPGMQMESFIIKELVPAIDKRYRTRTDAEGRAITGLSMGGHGALWLAIRHPDVFGTAGSTSGGVDIRPFPKNWNMADFLGPKDENPARWDAHTVINLVDSITPGKPKMIIDCGTDDFFYDVNCQFVKALNDRKIPHRFITGPGSHWNGYWSKSIHPQLEFFRRAFDGTLEN